MIQEKLAKLRPFVTGIRFVKNLAVVDVILKEGWNIFESETVTYKPSATNAHYFMVFAKNPEDNPRLFFLCSLFTPFYGIVE